MHLGCGSWERALPDPEVVIGMGQSSAEVRIIRSSSSVCDATHVTRTHVTHGTQVLNDRGVCYYELAEFASAIVSFNGAVQLNPDYPQAYTNRGNCHRKLGQSVEALHDYSKVRGRAR